MADNQWEDEKRTGLKIETIRRGGHHEGRVAYYVNGVRRQTVESGIKRIVIDEATKDAIDLRVHIENSVKGLKRIFTKNPMGKAGERAFTGHLLDETKKVAALPMDREELLDFFEELIKEAKHNDFDE